MIARSARGAQKHRPAAHPHPVRTVCFSQNRTWTHNLISKLKPLTGLLSTAIGWPTECNLGCYSLPAKAARFNGIKTVAIRAQRSAVCPVAQLHSCPACLAQPAQHAFAFA